MPELRLFPRLRTDLDVEITNQAGQTATAKIGNISPGGVMIDGDLETRDLISADTDKDPLNRPVEVRIRCQFGEHPVPFRCRCRLVFVRRLSQKQFNFGFRFVDMNAETAVQLERYLGRSLNLTNNSTGRRKPA